MRKIVDWWNVHQVPLYVGTIVCSALVGLSFIHSPNTLAPLEKAINPFLGTLLFATFLSIPVTELKNSFRNTHFLGAVMSVNFLFLPPCVWFLSRFVADNQGLLLGFLLVLLTPCIDYVLVLQAWQADNDHICSPLRQLLC